MKVAICYCNWTYHSAFGREGRLVGFVRAIAFYTNSDTGVNDIVWIVRERVRRASIAESWGILGNI